jgi:shikimate kinase
VSGARADNVILIGMPGVGKSTVGVLLAKALNKNFIDTDVYIQSRENRRLQEILDTVGLPAFLALEERRVLELEPRNCVVATGGSVVYSGPAMLHLKQYGQVICLWLPMEMLEQRITDFGTRGVVMEHDQTFRQLYESRAPLYECHSGIRIDCTGLSHEQVVEKIARALP